MCDCMCVGGFVYESVPGEYSRLILNSYFSNISNFGCLQKILRISCFTINSSVTVDTACRDG